MRESSLVASAFDTGSPELSSKQVRPTMIDRAIGYFSPESGLARYRARVQMAVAGQWLGGRTDRRETAGWLPFAGSADSDNLYDLPNARTRSRDLQRNNPLALGATNTAVTSIVGTGLSLRSAIDAEVLGMTEDEAQEWQAKTEREFRFYAENPRECDVESTLDFYAQQALALRACLDSGDLFALLPFVKRPNCTYSTKVQLVEADRVCNKDYASNTPSMAGGVVVDKWGAPTKYHVLRSHPGDIALSGSQLKWDEIPAFGARTGRRNVIHLFQKRRPGQRRGMPFLAPVIEAIHQLGEFTNAELRAAVVGAMFTVFVKTTDGDGLGLDGNGGPATSTPKSGQNVKLGNGAIVDLAPGEEVSFADPKRPTDSFEPFVKASMQFIGSALEIPVEILLKQFTTSYTAGRAAMLEAWRFYRVRREWLGSGFCQPIYEAWLDESIAMGRIEAPGFADDPIVRAAYLGSEWVGDAPGQIDELKEVNAAEKRLGLLLTTHEDEQIKLNGGVWRDTVTRRGREEELLRRTELTRWNANGQDTEKDDSNASD